MDTTQRAGHESDEALLERIAAAKKVGSSYRRFELLLRVPVEARAAVEAEAGYISNVAGGRYSDNVADAIRYYESGQDFASPLAQSLDPRNARTTIDGDRVIVKVKGTRENGTPIDRLEAIEWAFDYADQDGATKYRDLSPHAARCVWAGPEDSRGYWHVELIALYEDAEVTNSMLRNTLALFVADESLRTILEALDPKALEQVVTTLRRSGEEVNYNVPFITDHGLAAERLARVLKKRGF